MPIVLRDLLAHPLAQRLGWALAHSLWQFILVAALLAVALVLLRRRSAQARYLAACGAMLLCAIATVATFVILGDVPGHAAPTPDPAVATAPHVILNERAVAPTGRHEITLLERIEAILPWAALGWAAGVCAMSLRNVAGWLRVRTLRQGAELLIEEPWPRTFGRLCSVLGVRRAVALGRCDRVDVPSVIGWLKPIVLVPAGALMGLSAAQLEALLAHELAHVRRHDYLVNLIQTVIETLLFYHPAVWWVSRVIRREREHCCDDLAAAACGDRRSYAHALARMEELRLGGATTLALAASGTALLPRIRRLMGVSAPARRSARSLSAAIVALACAALPLVVGQLHARQVSKPEGETPSTAPAERLLTSGDWMIVAITDLEGPGSETFKQAQVAQDGNITLRDALGPIRAQGLTPRELEVAVAQRIREKGLVQNAQVKVTFPEPRREAVSPAPVAPELEKLLQKRIPEFRLEGTALSDVIDFLRDVTDANIFVNWRALERAGIDRTAPVTLRCRDVSFDKVLRLLLEEVGGGTVRLSYTADQNVISISVAEDPPEGERPTGGERPEKAAAPATGEYYLSGVERNSSYSVTEGDITLRQAIIAGGLKDAAGKFLVRVSRDPRSGATRTEIFPLDEVIKTKQGETFVRVGDVLMVTDEAPAPTAPTTAASKPVAEQAYYVSGDVPRDGMFMLGGRRITVLQALITAGADPPAMKDKVVTVHRKRVVILRANVRDLIEKEAVDQVIEPGDIVQVTAAPPK